jgi:putative Mg2+ transporter-C (MgtC) family protein
MNAPINASSPALNWACDSLRDQLSSPWLEIVLVLVAILCGAIVGSEREHRVKPAGLRTLILVCLGSAVFTMLSYAFISSTQDSGRVAAQVVTGIGFLGAGAILHSRTVVTGMTTAATIWFTAAIGMTTGAGFPAAAVGLTLLARAVLVGILEWEIRRTGGMKSITIDVVYEPDHGKTLVKLQQIRCEYNLKDPVLVPTGPDEPFARVRFRLHLPQRPLYEFLDRIASEPGVRELREVAWDHT